MLLPLTVGTFVSCRTLCIPTRSFRYTLCSYFLSQTMTSLSDSPQFSLNTPCTHFISTHNNWSVSSHSILPAYILLAYTITDLSGSPQFSVSTLCLYFLSQTMTSLSDSPQFSLNTPCTHFISIHYNQSVGLTSVFTQYSLHTFY